MTTEQAKKIIADKGLKKIFVAAKIGVSPSLLSMWFKGERTLNDEAMSKLKQLLKK